MLHPETELRRVNESIGYGVFATRFIPRGTITWALDPLDQVLARESLAGLEHHEELLTRYTWINGSGDRILCWDFARFMNHDCQANTLWAGGFDFEIAVSDIAAGDELTCDYGALNLEEPFPCACGAAACRRVVRPEDFESLASDWNARIRIAFPDVLNVEQPLLQWLEPQLPEIHRRARHPDEIDSVLRHRWMKETRPVGV